MKPFRFGVDVAHALSRLEWTESVRESNTMPPNVGGKGTCRPIGWSVIATYRRRSKIRLYGDLPEAHTPLCNNTRED
jgi:hypothetical protein